MLIICSAGSGSIELLCKSAVGFSPPAVLCRDWIVKSAILDAGVALVNPAIAIILALGQFAISKKSKTKERQFVLDEIDIEIEMCKRYLRQAEDQNDLEAQKKILRIQRNLERQKQRIQYKMKIYWNQDIPNIKNDDE